MRTKKIVLALAALVACMCIVCTSCSGGGGGGGGSTASSSGVPSSKDSSLIGKWVNETDSNDVMEFKADDSFWGASGNKLYLGDESFVFIIPYQISGNKLTLNCSQADGKLGQAAAQELSKLTEEEKKAFNDGLAEAIAEMRAQGSQTYTKQS